MKDKFGYSYNVKLKGEVISKDNDGYESVNEAYQAGVDHVYFLVDNYDQYMNESVDDFDVEVFDPEDELDSYMPQPGTFVVKYSDGTPYATVNNEYEADNLAADIDGYFIKIDDEKPQEGIVECDEQKDQGDNFEVPKRKISHKDHKPFIQERLNKGDVLSIHWTNPNGDPGFAYYLTYVGKDKNGNYKLQSEMYGWTYLVSADGKTVITPNGKEYPADPRTGWVKILTERVEK